MVANALNRMILEFLPSQTMTSGSGGMPLSQLRSPRKDQPDRLRGQREARRSLPMSQDSKARVSADDSNLPLPFRLNKGLGYRRKLAEQAARRC